MGYSSLTRRSFLTGIAAASAIPSTYAQQGGSTDSDYYIGFPLESKWESPISYDAADVGGYIDDLIYVGLSEFGTQNDKLAALDINSGQEQWSLELPGLVGSPYTDEEHIFLTAGDRILSVDSNTQSKLWESEFTQGQALPYVFIQDDRIFAASWVVERRETNDESHVTSGELVSFDKNTGNRNWEQMDEPVAGLSVSEDNVFAVTAEQTYNSESIIIESDGNIHAYDSESGEPLWGTNNFSPFGSPIPRESELVGLGRNGDIYGFDYSDGSEQWSLNISNSTLTSVVDGDSIYLGNIDGQVSAFNPKRQSVTWQREFDRTIEWISQYEEILYLGSSRGNIWALDRKTGGTVWTHSLPTEAAPIVVVRQDIAFIFGIMDSIYAFAGQRALAQEEINQAERKATSSVINTVSGILDQQSYLSRAKSAFENQQYQRAKNLAGKAENQAQKIETTGGVVGGIGILGGIIGSAKKVKQYSRKKSIEQEYDAAVQRANEIQESVDFDIRIESHIKEANPSNHDSLDKAEKVVNEFESYLTQISEIIRQRRKLKERRDVLLSEKEYSRVNEAITETTEIIRQDDSIDEAQKRLEKASTLLDAYELKQSLNSRLDTIDETISSISTTSIKQDIEQVDVSENLPRAISELESYQSIIDKIERAEDLADWNSSLPLDGVVTGINRAIKDEPVEEAAIEERLTDFEHLRESAENVIDFLENVNEDHLEIDKYEILDNLNKAISEGDLNKTQGLEEHINRLSEASWVAEDLFQYDWESFEHLISRLWSDMGYSTTVTRASSDRGIDVIARNNTETLLIQVKQNSPGNKVGRPTIQKTAGVLSGENAGRAIVITTSSYTKTAVEEAQRHGGTIELISGQKLLKMLNESRLPPPK